MIGEIFIQRTKYQFNETPKGGDKTEKYWIVEKIDDDKLYHMRCAGESKTVPVYFRGKYQHGEKYHVELIDQTSDSYHNMIENFVCFERWMWYPDWLERFKQKLDKRTNSATVIQAHIRGVLIRLKKKCKDHDWVYQDRDMYEPSVYECSRCDARTNTPTTPNKRKCLTTPPGVKKRKIGRFTVYDSNDETVKKCKTIFM
jgi:hypothetical protein